MTLLAFDAAYGAAVGTVPIAAAGGIACNWYCIRGYASTSMGPAQARAGGLGSIVNAEGTAGELVGMTRAQGQAFAQEFMVPIHAAGVPLDGSVSVFCSVDVPLADVTVCDDAFLGIRDVVGGLLQVRAYGQGSLISHLRARGLSGKGWLSASRSYPGWDANSPDVCMWQDVSSPVPNTDLNHITDVDSLGAWWPDNSPHGDTLSAADVAAINAHTDAAVSAIIAHIDQRADGLVTEVRNARTDVKQVVTAQSGAVVAAVQGIPPVTIPDALGTIVQAKLDGATLTIHTAP